MNIKKDITSLIGNTPLIRLNKISDKLGVEIVAKCEFLNPTSSIKDRAAFSMIEDAKRSGKLNSNTTIIEPTSGNTGIALAALCAMMDIKLILTMPQSMSLERRKILLAYGAKLELTPKEKGMQGSIDKAKELQLSIQNSIILQQFENMANPKAHENTTAKEILDDTEAKLEYFVTSIGTGGTFSGVSKVLKEVNPNIKTIAVEPKNSAVLSGESMAPHKIQGIGAGFIPSITDTTLIDGIEKVSDEDAYEMARALAKDEGLLVGISSGANVYASTLIAKKYKPSMIVTILPDTGERYLSGDLF